MILSNKFEYKTRGTGESSSLGAIHFYQTVTFLYYLRQSAVLGSKGNTRDGLYYYTGPAPVSSEPVLPELGSGTGLRRGQCVQYTNW
jgi:hypothetical protein